MICCIIQYKKGGIMLENILPNDLCKALDQIPYKNLCEMRLRANDSVVVNVLGENYYLCNDRLSLSSYNAIQVSLGTINAILQRMSNNSIYTINDDIINGFVTISGGIRVGVCGEVVSIDGKIKTIKNISSMNFRFPHFIKNCSLNIYPYLVKNGNVYNTLIMSKPGAGKTTYLRDIVYQLSQKEKMKNILLIDERKELSSIFDGCDVINIKNIDVYSNSSKKFAFNNGIRSMNPDVIITDEINIEKDIEDIENAITSGVSIIATLHAGNIEDLRHKPAFERILANKLFDRYVVLSDSSGIGTCEGVYNENLICIGV